MKKKTSLKNIGLFFIIYTVIYLAITGLIYYYFNAQNKSMVYHYDGWYQHIKALTYYSQWLRDSIGSLLHGDGLKTWTFGIGYGADIITTLSYYCIGDPLTLLSVFFSRGNIIYLYHFLLLLRPYLGGLFFALYCYYKLSHDRYDQNTSMVRGGISLPVMIGAAIAYDFSEVTLYLGRWHPYFIIPLVIFPLILLGVEKIFCEKKPWLYIIAVFLGGVSNFYFFYMMMIFTALYIIVRGFKNWNISEYSRYTCIESEDHKRKSKDDNYKSKDDKNKSEDDKHNSKDYESKGKKTLVLSSIRSYIFGILPFAPYTLLGISLAAVMFLPIVISFVQNPRSGLDFAVYTLYEPRYYVRLLRNLITFVDHPMYDTQVGLSSPVIAAIILVFCVKGHKRLKVVTVLTAMGLILPVCGWGLNGFSYMINRWTFAVVMLGCYILVALFEEIMSLSAIRSLVFALLCFGYACLLKGLHLLNGEDINPRDNARVSIRILIIFALIVLVNSIVRNNSRFAYTKRKDIFRVIVGTIAMALTVTSVVYNIYYGYEGSKGNFSQDFMDKMNAQEYETQIMNNEVLAVEKAASLDSVSDSLYRYSGYDLVWNGGILDGVSSTDFYFSLANGNISNFLTLLGVKEQFTFGYQGLDERFILNTLANVRYYTISAYDETQTQFVPFGFTQRYDVPEGEIPWSTVTNYKVFSNVMPLSVGMNYTGYINESDFMNASLTERQEMIAQGVVVSDEAADKLAAMGYDACEPEYTQIDIPYTISVSDGVTVTDSAFVSTVDGGTVTFNFQGMPNCETYLCIKDLVCKDEENARFLLTFEGFYDADAQGEPYVTKTLMYQTPLSQFYSNWHDFIINMGMRADASYSIRLTLPADATYSFDNISIVCQSMDMAAAKMMEHLSEPMTDLDLHLSQEAHATDTVTGNVSLSKDSLVLLSIPYTKGWTAYVDGVETDLVQADVMYMAVPVSAGDHTIELRYHTSGLLAGCIVSIVSLLVLILFMIYVRNKGRKRISEDV